MVNVAVLGGSGHVGKTIVEAIKSDPNHSVIVLSRQAATTPDAGAPTVVADYNDEKSLASILETHQVHTVISCVGVHDERLARVEAAAIRASHQSRSTKRFVASNWALPNTSASKDLTPWASFQRQAPELLRTTDLEWTEIANGYFLDYWGMPYIKTHLTPMIPVLDIQNKVAAIPGTGNEPVAFSYSFDVANMVVKLLDLPKWEETTYVVGDKLTWHEFLKLAQEARGSDFEVHYDDVEKLSKGQITELPNHVAAYPFFPKPHLQGLYSILEKMMADGDFDLPTEKAINSQFPEYKMLTAKELLAQTWKAQGGR